MNFVKFLRTPFLQNILRAAFKVCGSRSRLLKDKSFHKDWNHATGRLADNLPYKIKIYENFRTPIPRNKRNMIISFF